VAPPSRRDRIAAIAEAALAAVEPGAAIERALIRDGDRLTVGGRELDLSRLERIRVLGAGKPGAPMARAAVAILDPLVDDGLVIVKHGHGEADVRSGPVEIVGAGHPVPDEAGVAAARRAAALAAELGQRDLLIALVGGGASALLTLPADGLTLGDLGRTTAELLGCGAEITELNAVRKHLSAIKGGQLARLAAPAATVGLVLSDVVGDPLDGIGSGPTAPDPTTFADAWAVVERYGLEPRLPSAVTERLRRGVAGEIPETPDASDPIFERVENHVIAGNRHAVRAAVDAARELGFEAQLVTTSLTGEAREAGARIAAMVRERVEREDRTEGPLCLVLGGETTVTLRGDGRGGRNQELALAAAIEIDGQDRLAVVSLATDGQDGPTDAAGAMAFGDTVARARALGLDPRRHLEANDSYPLFDALGDLIRTGPTLTNVADVILAFVF
jgi:hydroxypyruvate reductase